ncbi:hypothetical protein SAMN06264364_15013 [Quadrisphaera granulorum]|uniref:Uncharacterized protein n=1 Tax=Quadrisphaera granulorum TaxID=317664 RepID=A0A315ZM95_9ACTN|nr:hypothetical protein [Quadrisphaera granulorum]PWJ45814.1 hypothetical protein BXY45_15013 [Quadrisphaera granulorum]SZE99119.1 hypothetical protein SAMN06264364_15013 [Quadrisphaera granulorum]
MSTATSPAPQHEPQHEGQHAAEHEGQHAAEHEERRRESWEYAAVHEVLVDEHTDGIADAALAQLASVRQAWLGDPLTSIALITALVQQYQRYLPELVDEARQEEASWAQVAAVLGMPADVAAERYDPDRRADPASRIEHGHGHQIEHSRPVERGRPFAPEPTPDPRSEPIPDPTPDLLTSPPPAGRWDPAPFPHF